MNKIGPQFSGQDGLENRIRSLAETHEVEEIASIAGVSIHKVTEVLGNMRGSWLLIDSKTGRHWKRNTERGCYLMAQMLGLVDYTFGREA